MQYEIILRIMKYFASSAKCEIKKKTPSVDEVFLAGE